MGRGPTVEPGGAARRHRRGRGPGQSPVGARQLLPRLGDRGRSRDGPDHDHRSSPPPAIHPQTGTVGACGRCQRRRARDHRRRRRCDSGPIVGYDRVQGTAQGSRAAEKRRHARSNHCAARRLCQARFRCRSPRRPARPAITSGPGDRAESLGGSRAPRAGGERCRRCGGNARARQPRSTQDRERRDRRRFVGTSRATAEPARIDRRRPQRSTRRCQLAVADRAVPGQGSPQPEAGGAGAPPSDRIERCRQARPGDARLARYPPLLLCLYEPGRSPWPQRADGQLERGDHHQRPDRGDGQRAHREVDQRTHRRRTGAHQGIHRVLHPLRRVRRWSRRHVRGPQVLEQLDDVAGHAKCRVRHGPALPNRNRQDHRRRVHHRPGRRRLASRHHRADHRPRPRHTTHVRDR